MCYFVKFIVVIFLLNNRLRCDSSEKPNAIAFKITFKAILRLTPLPTDSIFSVDKRAK